MNTDPLENERRAERQLSKRWQDQQNDLFLARGKEKWAPFRQQQQQSRGFAQYGATQIPATVTWLSAAFDNTATYAAGNGYIPLPGSFVQVAGSVYAIPGTVASTPGTAPPGGVWVVQPPAPGGNGWQVNPNTRFSSYAQNFLTFQWPPNYVDQPDAAWWPGDSQVIDTTPAHYYIPAPGRLLLVGTFATNFPLVQANIAGTWTTLFTTTAATCQWFEFDGLTWRIQNPATSTRQTYTMYRIKQSVDYP
jgi:hypothetical protein